MTYEGQAYAWPSLQTPGGRRPVLSWNRIHKMKKIIAAAALLTAPMTVLASPALAADFVTLHLTIDVAAPIDKVWSRVGGYCQMDWLDRGCQFTAGAGEVGTIRQLSNKGVV